MDNVIHVVIFNERQNILRKDFLLSFSLNRLRMHIVFTGHVPLLLGLIYTERERTLKRCRFLIGYCYS